MSVQWGSWSYSGNNGMRVGIDVSTSKVTSTSSSVTFTWKVYTQNRYRYADNGEVLATSGAVSSSTTFNNTSGSGAVVLRATKTSSYTYSTYGSSPGTQYLSASVSGTYNGSHPRVTRRVTIPARPIATPDTPTGTVVSRSSDTMSTVSWTNHTSKPYTSVTVQRSLDSGSDTTIATIKGSPTSYRDTANLHNHSVQYRVRANNGAGSSSWSGHTAAYYNSMDAPTNVVATLNSDNTVTLDWSQKQPGWGWAHYSTVIQRSSDGGSTWTTINAGRGAGYFTNTDTTKLTGGTYLYRIAAKSQDTSGNTGPQTAWVQSNVVGVAAPPLAATNLSPSGVVDVEQSFTHTWAYHSGPDNAKQSAFEVQWSTDGGSTWTSSGKITSTASTWTRDPSLWTNGSTYVWQVRTWGVHADPGPWSASSTITAKDSPTATITTPVDPVQLLPVIMAWEYAQTDGDPQATWSAVLWGVSEDDDTADRLEDSSGTDESQWAPTTAFVNNQSYRLDLTVTSSSGLSGTASVTFSIDLLPPADVDLVSSFDADSGSVQLTVSATEAQEGVSAAVAYVDIQRRINTGKWVTIIAGVDLTEDSRAAVLDLLPNLNAVNSYRVAATSIAPSQGLGDPQDVVIAGFADCQWGFLNWGDDLSLVERGTCDPSVSQTASRIKETYSVAGRRFPLALIGDYLTHTVPVAFTIDARPPDCPPDDDEGSALSSSPADWIRMGHEASTVVYRDWTGRRVYGVVGEVSVSDETNTLRVAKVSFTVTRTDWTEGVDPTTVEAGLVGPGSDGTGDGGGV